ncbi:MAG: transport permease protein [Planctomycetota bacterium]|nr:ABC transporter permease [Planctomycetota bacterium]GIK52483.1 MAG: transport permease protein [Planctomycetota bacterium]
MRLPRGGESESGMNLPGDINLSMALCVWRRNFTVYRHTWVTNILPNFFEPVLFLVGMGLGLGVYVGGNMRGQDYVAFIAPGLMASAAMNGASFEASWNMYIKMYFSKLYDAYLATPAQMQDIAFGELLWGTTRALIYGAGFLVVLLGFTLAGRPILTSWWTLLVPLALALIGAIFSLMGQWYTTLINTIDLYSYYWTLFLTPMFLFSGIFFPVSDIPGGTTIAWFTPLFHGVELVRGLCQGPLELRHLGHTGYMLAVCALLLWAVPRRMRKRMVK